MVFFILIGFVIILLWITAGFRAKAQPNKKALFYFYLHLIGALLVVLIGFFLIRYNGAVYSCDTCNLNETFYLLLLGVGGIVLLVYPIVLLFIWRPPNR